MLVIVMLKSGTDIPLYIMTDLSRKCQVELWIRIAIYHLLKAFVDSLCSLVLYYVESHLPVLTSHANRTGIG